MMRLVDLSVNCLCFSDDEVEEGNRNPPSDTEFDQNKDDKKEVKGCLLTVCLLTVD